MSPAKRKSAFFSATQEAQKSEEQCHSETVRQDGHETLSDHQQIPVPPSSSATAIPSHSATVEPSQRKTEALSQSGTVPHEHGATVKKEAKTSFYLTPQQVEKLDDLAYEHKKKTGKRINRNDIVRYLIDRCELEDLRDIAK